MFDYYGAQHVYTAHELQRMMLTPFYNASHFGKSFFTHSFNPVSYTLFGRQAAAGCALMERVMRIYSKPEFGINHTMIEGKKVRVQYEITARKTFCRILHFKKPKTIQQTPLLIVAPLSGHYCTLLRGTVEALLPHYDIYITDWRNANEVPVAKGGFDLDDYIDYMMEWMPLLGKDLHVMAVCQPGVPVLAALSRLAAQKAPVMPKSVTIIGSPIDTRKSPTEVNQLAEKRPFEWFKHNVISRVPYNYPGFMRLVYPGFVQLTGFMTMNMDRHIEAHTKLFDHLVEGDGDSVTAHKKFYNEYLSVMDIPAEFYLQTIRTVFQEHSLPKKTMLHRGEKVDPSLITKTALLTIEGERDDISGRGQTKAAHTLCSGLSAEKKQHLLQKGVGHYGTFNGRRFREEIVPVLRQFITQHS